MALTQRLTVRVCNSVELTDLEYFSTVRRTPCGGAESQKFTLKAKFPRSISYCCVRANRLYFYYLSPSPILIVPPQISPGLWSYASMPLETCIKVGGGAQWQWSNHIATVELSSNILTAEAFYQLDETRWTILVSNLKLLSRQLTATISDLAKLSWWPTGTLSDLAKLSWRPTRTVSDLAKFSWRPTYSQNSLGGRLGMQLRCNSCHTIPPWSVCISPWKEAWEYGVGCKNQSRLHINGQSASWPKKDFILQP